MKSKTENKPVRTYAEVEINWHIVKLMVEDTVAKPASYMSELARWTRKLENDLRAGIRK